MQLRAFRPEDAGAIASFLHSEEEFLWWSAGNLGTYPLEPGVLAAYYAAHADAGDWMPCTLVEGDAVRGHMLMRWKDRAQGALHFGFIVVDTSLRGKGFGSGMLRMALEHAFGELMARRVSLNVYADNAPAIRCYERLGFACAGEFELDAGGKRARVLQYERRADA